MEMIDEVLMQNRASTEQKGLSGKFEEIQGDVEHLSKRFERLAKLQSLVKEKYHKRLETLLDQLNNANRRQFELKSLEKQLKKNKEKQLILKKQIAGLERRKKAIQKTIKQVSKYEKCSDRQVETIEEEHQVLFHRIQDLIQALELADEAGLSENEKEIIYQRACATRGLLEEHEIDLRKRIIDLLFEFYIPPKNSRFIR